MDVLSLESLDKLSEYVSHNPDCTLLMDDFDSLSDRLSLIYVGTSYDFDLDTIELELPASIADKKLSDASNVKTLYGCMSTLTPAQATDERLWTTIALHHFQEYTKIRWWKENLDKDPPGKQFKSHWLCGSSPRDRHRNHSIARLWWMGYFATRLEGADIDDVTEIIFNNSDYRASLLERTSSTGASNVLSAILEITREAFAEGLKYERDKTREFMKRVNFIAGRSNLSALSSEQLVQLLRPIYRDSYGLAVKQKTGVLGKIMGLVSAD